MKDSFSRREHIGWVDLLRVLACFLVVFAHCCDPFVGQLDADRGAFLTGAFAGSLVRCSVPLFVMMTGVLLLPVGEGMGAFYRRRIGRIVPPLLFWSLALPLLFFAYLHTFGAATQSPTVDPASYTVRQLVVRLYTFVFNFNYDTTPLWYLYMLVGLYLVMPVLGAWLERASRRELQSVLAIWGLTLLLPYVKMLAPALGYTGNYGNTGLYGVCDWNEFGTFHYVSGFAGYLVLAFYLVKFPPAWNWRKTLGICIPTFLAGYLATGLGYVVMQKHFPGNYAYLEIVWYFAGINVFMMTAPVFILVQKAAARPRAWLSRLAGATFGIYLCHFIFVQAGYDLVQRIPGLPALARIALIACGAFAVSWAVVRLMQRWSVTRRLVE
jgi:surface polysaccharide O-acyltransferase-like enzyme